MTRVITKIGSGFSRALVEIDDDDTEMYFEIEYDSSDARRYGEIVMDTKTFRADAKHGANLHKQHY